MKKNILRVLIQYYDHFIKNVDFRKLPGRDSEEYRKLVMKTADEEVFDKGRLSQKTEYMLEIFKDDDAQEAEKSLWQINDLSDAERKRWGFYKDVKDMSFPLFVGQETDFRGWPWNMKDGEGTMDNEELFDFLTEGGMWNLSAAVEYALFHRIWMEEGGRFTSVAKQELSDKYYHNVENAWKGGERKKLEEKVNSYANDMWFVENHIMVGEKLGFDYMMQSVYDAMDTYIDNTYRHGQVDFAKEMGKWMKVKSEEIRVKSGKWEKEDLDELYGKLKELMEKHHVTTPDFTYTWNILTLDVLGMSMDDVYTINADASTSSAQALDDDDDWE